MLKNRIDLVLFGGPCIDASVNIIKLEPLMDKSTSYNLRLLTLTGRLMIEQGMDLHLLGWTWQHDLNTEDVYGLSRREFSEKLVFLVWKSLVGPD